MTAGFSNRRSEFMKKSKIKRLAGILLALCLPLQGFMAMSVTAAGVVPSVKLDKRSVSFNVGESVEISAQVTPANASNKAVRFIATNDKIILGEPLADAASGKTSVVLTASGNVSASVIAVCEDGFATDLCEVRVGTVLEESEMINRADDGGTIAVSSEASGVGEDKTKAFDNSASTKWLVTNTSSAWISYRFTGGNKYFITKYAIVSGNDDPERDPKNWELQGSNDGEEWDVLDRRTDEVFYGRKLKRIFEFEPEKAYEYYRLFITENSGGTHTQLSEIQLFECGDYPSWGMGPFVKMDESNPILEPNTTDRFFCPVRGQEILWTDLSLYNPTAIVKDGVINLLYRAQDATDTKTSRVGLATSTDGLTFERRSTPVIYPDNTYNQYEWGGGCEDPRVIEGPDGKYYIYYTGYNGSIALLMVASSDDLINWDKHGLVFADAYDGKYSGTWSKSGSVITEIVDGKQVAKKIDGKFWMYWGESDFFMASSDDLIHWTPLEDESGNLVSVMKPRPGMYDSFLVEPGPAAIYTEDGIFMLYNCCNNSPDGTGDPMLANRAYCPGQVMFDRDDPTKVIHRTSSYFMYPEEDYELEGLVNNVCFIEGLIYYNDIWYVYYGTADSRLAVATWDPTANLPAEKAVNMETGKLTVHAGQSVSLSASLGAGETSDRPLRFISTNDDISLSDPVLNPETGVTSVTLTAAKECAGTIVAINEDTFESDVCAVSATAAFEAVETRFFADGEAVKAVAAGDMSMEIDISGHYDTEVSLTPVIALYKNGVLENWAAADPQSIKIDKGGVTTLRTPAINIPEIDNMREYDVKGFLWDDNRAPSADAVVPDKWFPENLALGKTVFASSQEDDNVPPSAAVDGDMQTRWASGSSDNQWLRVDLGSAMDINHVIINWESAYSSKYRIDVSLTGNSADFTTVYSTSDARGGITAHSFDTVKARYVRLYCETRATTWGNSVWEFGVYNLPAEFETQVTTASEVQTTTLTGNDFDLLADPDGRTVAVSLTLPGEADDKASVICLNPDYSRSSEVKDASDYLDFRDSVCALDQYSFDESGNLNFILPLKEVLDGDYTLALSTNSGIYICGFDFSGILPGDLDRNKIVNVADVVALRQIIMSGSWTASQLAAGDLDENGSLNVSDVVALRTKIMK